MKKPNIIGVKFNKLTVIKQEGFYKNGEELYICECDCGSSITRQTSYNHLKRGEVKSCGCLVQKVYDKFIAQSKLRTKNILGETFGRLTVVNESSRTKYGVQWLCNCSCGKTKIVSGVNLRKKNGTQSCGCLGNEIRSERNKSRKNSDPWQVETNATKSSAVYRKIEFKLSTEEFKSLVLSNCHYCDKSPEMNCQAIGLREQNILVNGIDRIDSKIGYIPNNCVSCCTQCNTAKMSKTYEEFIENTKQRFLFLFKKGIIILE